MVDQTYALAQDGVYGQSNGVYTDALESPIPDSLDYHWPGDEGSGSILANSEGSVDISLNFSTWTSGSQYNGGIAPDFDGVDDIGITDSTIGINGSQATVCAWLENINAASSYTGIFNCSPDETPPSDGFDLFFEQAENEVGFRHHDSGWTNNIARNISVPDTSITHTFIAIVIDGNTGELYAYDTGQQQANVSGTASRNQTGSESLSVMAGAGDFTEGVMDDITVSTTSALSQPEIEEVWQATGPNA